MLRKRIENEEVIMQVSKEEILHIANLAQLE